MQYFSINDPGEGYWPDHRLLRWLVILAQGATLSDLARILHRLQGQLEEPLRQLQQMGMIAALPAYDEPVPLLPLYRALHLSGGWLNILLFGWDGPDVEWWYQYTFWIPEKPPVAVSRSAGHYGSKLQGHVTRPLVFAA